MSKPKKSGLRTDCFGELADKPVTHSGTAPNKGSNRGSTLRTNYCGVHWVRRKRAVQLRACPRSQREGSEIMSETKDLAVLSDAELDEVGGGWSFSDINVAIVSVRQSNFSLVNLASQQANQSSVSVTQVS